MAGRVRWWTFVLAAYVTVLVLSRDVGILGVLGCSFRWVVRLGYLVVGWCTGVLVMIGSLMLDVPG